MPLLNETAVKLVDSILMLKGENVRSRAISIAELYIKQYGDQRVINEQRSASEFPRNDT